MMKYLLIYFAAIAIISVAVTCYDKHCAKRGKWRIPESTLLTLGFLGGALPMYVCMKCIHHKTKKLKFMLPLPMFAVLHICLIIFVQIKL